MKQKLLIIDYGLYCSIAARFGRDSRYDVRFFTPWAELFPKPNEAMIGEGIEGVTRVNYLWDNVDWANYILCFDTNFEDLIAYLRAKGYKVFGPGKEVVLENDRFKSKKIQQAVGIPVQKIAKIVGLDNLRKYLTTVKDKYVKINIFRGTIETFRHKDIKSSTPLLDHLAYSFGPKQKSLEFVVEDPIDGCEPGYDGFVVDGKYPNIALTGFEVKDSSYAGKIFEYDKLPTPIKDVNDRLAPVFKKFSARTIYSTEVRIDKQGKGYLIDATIRAPMPPISVEMEIYDNFTDFIIAAAEGKMIDLKAKYKYGVEFCLDSEWAAKNWLEVTIPKEIMNFVKLKRACKIDGKYYTIPIGEGYTGVCSVVGLGNTFEEALSEAKKRVGMVDAYQLNVNIDEEKLRETLKEAEKYNIKI